MDKNLADYIQSRLFDWAPTIRHGIFNKETSPLRCTFDPVPYDCDLIPAMPFQCAYAFPFVCPLVGKREYEHCHNGARGVRFVCEQII